MIHVHMREQQFIGALDDEATTSRSGHREIELDRCIKELMFNNSQSPLTRLLVHGDPEVSAAVRKRLMSLSSVSASSEYVLLRQECRQLLADRGIPSNPGWSDEDIVAALRGATTR